MQVLVRLFSRLTETVAAAMMAAIFCTFILQITVRYVLGSTWFQTSLGGSFDVTMFGWTLEFIMVMWLWTIFWGNAFIVREQDHVTFDILYLAAPRTLRRVFAVIGAVAIVVALWGSIDDTYSKMRILRIKSSATLPVKMLPIYSIYFLFLAVVGVRYAWRVVEVIRKGPPDEGHHLPMGDE